MKIIIKSREPIRIYHNPREVCVHPKSETVTTLNSDGSLLEKFKLVKKETSWNEDMNDDKSELIITLTVEK